MALTFYVPIIDFIFYLIVFFLVLTTVPVYDLYNNNNNNNNNGESLCLLMQSVLSLDSDDFGKFGKFVEKDSKWFPRWFELDLITFKNDFWFDLNDFFVIFQYFEALFLRLDYV